MIVSANGWIKIRKYLYLKVSNGFRFDHTLIIIMSPSALYTCLVFILFACSVSNGFDVVIYGATPGGITAAITAARASPSYSIVIIEPTSNIGGMATAGGIGLRDLGLEVTSELNINIV